MGKHTSAVAVSLLALFAALAVNPSSLLAQEAPVEIYRSRQGPYEMAMSILPETPLVGIVHFTVTLAFVETGQPVADAEVLLIADDDKGKPTYQTLALNSPADRLRYQANITFERAGEWSVRVRVTEEQSGGSEFAVPLTVGEAALGPGLAGTYIWLLVVVVLVGGAFLIFRAARWKQSKG